MPIWDYDSGLYWTGYYTTDPYHKKQYRDVGRYLYALRKICLPWYLKTGSKAGDAKLEELAEQVAYLQHHDGISGTSKYSVMDSLEFTNIRLLKAAHEEILLPVFNSELPIIDNQILFECNLDERCVIPRVVETVIVRMLSSDSGS